MGRSVAGLVMPHRGRSEPDRPRFPPLRRRLRLLLAAALLGQGCSSEEVLRHHGSSTVVHGRPVGEVWVWRDCPRGSQRVVVHGAAGTDITIQTVPAPPERGAGCHPWYGEARQAAPRESPAEVRQRMVDRMRGDWPR